VFHDFRSGSSSKKRGGIISCVLMYRQNEDPDYGKFNVACTKFEGEMMIKVLGENENIRKFENYVV
jgi:hypothetical protein